MGNGGELSLQQLGLWSEAFSKFLGWWLYRHVFSPCNTKLAGRARLLWWFIDGFFSWNMDNLDIYIIYTPPHPELKIEDCLASADMRG